MTNEQILFPVIQEFHNKIQNEDFVIDKSGVKCVEIIAAKIKNLDPLQALLDFKVKKTNEIYCKKELSWYLSQDLNIYPQMQDVTIWKQVADKNGFINSNYGWCIFAKENYSQYENCKNELIKNKESRRALMIYTRPSIWIDYNQDGRSDYICCISNQFFIRNNKLISIVNFRSQDFIYGFFNDFYWKCWVYNKLYDDLKIIYPELLIGYIDWNIGSLHCYEKHFSLLEKIYTNN